jgi:hypothetical protein
MAAIGRVRFVMQVLVRVRAANDDMLVLSWGELEYFSLLVIDPDNPGHWIEIQGHVGELRDEEHGAREHINALSEKYTGNSVYSITAQGNDRQMYLIDAVKINGR